MGSVVIRAASKQVAKKKRRKKAVVASEDEASDANIILVNPAPPTKKVMKVKHEVKNEIADRPKRPLSAYNLFFKDQRIKLLGLDDDGKGEKEKKIGFAEMAKVISSKWKTL